MKRYNVVNGRTLLQALGAALLAPAIAFAQSSAPALREGVVVDTAGGSAYVTSPTGTINAIDLVTGSSRWTSDAAAKPLAVSQDTLVAQASPAEGEQLVVVSIDTDDGAAKARAKVALPNNLKAGVSDSPTQKTLVKGLLSGNAVLVSWSIQTQFARGVNFDNEAAVVTGAARIDPTTGAAVEVAETPEDSGALSNLTLAQMMQMASIDGQHTVRSESTASGNFRWSVRTADGTTVGSFETSQSMGPFVVSGSRLYYVAAASGIRTGERFVTEPLRLRCMDLGSGAQLWAVPVLDTSTILPPP